MVPSKQARELRLAARVARSKCPSGELHLQSGVNPRHDDPVGAGGPVREITPCREAEPSIYAGTPSSMISAAAV